MGGDPGALDYRAAKSRCPQPRGGSIQLVHCGGGQQAIAALLKTKKRKKEKKGHQQLVGQGWLDLTTHKACCLRPFLLFFLFFIFKFLAMVMAAHLPWTMGGQIQLSILSDYRAIKSGLSMVGVLGSDHSIVMGIQTTTLWGDQCRQN